MKLLLADDEYSIRSYLRTLIDWEAHGYTLLEAENGQAALDLIKEHNINLALMDISMPVMSGLEALSILNGLNTGCVVTLLTCHDEFEYAQKALKLGCFDYVLKSDISAENILQVIDKMKNALSEELRQRQYEEEIAASVIVRTRHELQSAFCYWLQSGSAPENSITGYIDKALNIKCDTMRHVAIHLVIKDYADVINRYTGSNATRFTEVFDNVARELLSGEDYIYAQTENGRFLIVLRYEKHLSTQNILAIVHELTRKIVVSFHSILNINVRLIYSLPFWGIQQAREIYLSADSLNEMSFFGDDEALVCIEDYNFDALAGTELLREMQSALSQELANRNLLQTEQTIRAFATRICEKRLFVLPADFIDVCKKCITGWLSEDENLQDNIRFDDVPDINCLITAVCEKVSPHCLTEDNTDKKNIVKKAILIIQQAYAEQISLESIAKQLFVNPSYLSHLFSEAMHQPITSYINNYRIEQAKKLITNSNLKLYEIAEKSGFSSHIVFSTCFKKITGETPTEYKNRLL